MTERVVTGHVTKLRECDTGFAADHLEKFPATTRITSPFAPAVMDNEKFARRDADRSAQDSLVFKIIAQGARVEAEESFKGVVVISGTVTPGTAGKRNSV